MESVSFGSRDAVYDVNPAQRNRSVDPALQLDRIRAKELRSVAPKNMWVDGWIAGNFVHLGRFVRDQIPDTRSFEDADLAIHFSS